MRKRNLNLTHPSFLNPQYELVVLHPEHFLPAGSVLTCYDPVLASHKTYTPSPDRRFLVTSPNPPFHRSLDQIAIRARY
ncbi:unnamed protein product [Cyclocybe aegerita]|uniref:Uncharacterized protein n=1 Tax=Cyclocybe aegerita TaxID=1973307 RepID=A0A8S0WH05_CYCAE|nr:unnamed protein product [Cyclocybe aegerita]